MNFIRMAEALFTFDFTEKLPEIRCGTLVIGSAGDGVFPLSCFQELTAGIRCDHYLYGREFGHAVYDEAPDYVERLYAFCSREAADFCR